MTTDDIEDDSAGEDEPTPEAKPKRRSCQPDAPRCQARTWHGTLCGGFACHGDTRCWRHGGVRTRPKTCTCAAYRWPHRPGGGLCRWPDPPLETCPTVPGKNRPTRLRRRGGNKWELRHAKLHPIRDRAAATAFLTAAAAAGRR